MTTRVHSNLMVRQDKIPFHVLVEDEAMVADQKGIGHGRDGPRFRNIVDRFVGNLRKQRRYIDHHDYKHERLCGVPAEHGENNCWQGSPHLSERSSSLDEIGGICQSDLHEFPGSSAFMGRRRSRSDTDLLACEIFARRRAAICEEMERNILMENGVTLRKCRKNLVLNQILENLSLL